MIFFFQTISSANEEFEGIIVSVNSEAITTFDLSERIKLVIKSLNLEDTIENRDSVRERVLDLLILEKLKKKEVTEAQLEFSEEELIQFTSSVYNFPVKEFDIFKEFIKDEGLDIDTILDQISIELLWSKFSQKKFSSLITISQDDIDRIVERNKTKAGKKEFNYSEILIENRSFDSWLDSKKRMEMIIRLLNNGSPFGNLALKFSDAVTADNEGNVGWILEDNLEDNLKTTLNNLNKGEVSGGIKSENGFKIIKLNDTRKNSEGMNHKFSFIKFSSYDQKLIQSFDYNPDNCSSELNKYKKNDELSVTRLENILANEISEVFLKKIQETPIKQISDEIEINGEYSKLLICKKSKDKSADEKKRIEIENKLFNEKFNQLSRTYISNLRKSANIKYINQ